MPSDRANKINFKKETVFGGPRCGWHSIFDYIFCVFAYSLTFCDNYGNAIYMMAITWHSQCESRLYFHNFNPKCESIGKNTKNVVKNWSWPASETPWNCYVPIGWYLPVWHSLRESTCLSGTENVCQVKIRGIHHEQRVLYTVICGFLYCCCSKFPSQ